MQVQSIAECSKGSILQYFGPSLIKLPFSIKTFIWSIFKCPLKTGLTVLEMNIVNFISTEEYYYMGNNIQLLTYVETDMECY